MPVYIAQLGADGPCKIGSSANVAERMRKLQLDHSAPLRLRRVLRGSGNEERGLHKMFASHRLEREWFMPEPKMFRDVGLADLTHLPREYLPKCGWPADSFCAKWSEAFFCWLERESALPDALAFEVGVRLSTFADWTQHGSTPDIQVREKLIELSGGALAPYLGPQLYQVLSRTRASHVSAREFRFPADAALSGSRNAALTAAHSVELAR